MNPEHKPAPISGLQLERYLLGALSAGERTAVEARLAADPALARKVERMRSQDLAFAARFPAETVVPEIASAARPAPRKPESPTGQARLPAPRPKARTRSNPPIGWRNRIALPFPISGRRALAFALILLCAAPLVLRKLPSDGGGERLKGKQAELRLYRNTSAGPERVASGSDAAAGDVFQVEFHPGTFAYGAVISVDGSGSVTLHWPARPDGSTAWSALPEHRLPSAFQLDDSPRFERFHLLLSRGPLDLGTWLARAAASAGRDEAWLAAQAPDSVSIVTFTLNKKP
jgi:hypothetical protein